MRHFILVSILACIGFYSCQSEKVEQDTDEDISSERQSSSQNENTFVITKQDLTLLEIQNAEKAILLPITGRVMPKNQTQLFSEVQGKILDRNFSLKEGVSFNKGDLLIALDATEFSLQLEAQRSAFLNILTGMMPDLKADYPDSYEQWLTYVQEYQSGQELKELPIPKNENEKYFITANQVYNTYFTIKAAEERYRKYQIIAPYSGIVTQTNIDKGSLVSPGQLLATIINNRQFELEAGVGLEVASKLKVGDKVIFKSNELKGEWIGTVIRMSDILDAKTQNIPIYFSIIGKNLKAGMYLEGNFKGDSFEDVVSIPSTALTRDNKVLLLENNSILGKEVELVEVMQDSVLVRGLVDKDVLISNQFNVPVEGLKLSM